MWIGIDNQYNQEGTDEEVASKASNMEPNFSPAENGNDNEEREQRRIESGDDIEEQVSYSNSDFEEEGVEDEISIAEEIERSE